MKIVAYLSVAQVMLAIFFKSCFLFRRQGVCQENFSETLLLRAKPSPLVSAAD